MLAALIAGSQELADALAGVAEETARRRPAAGKWSILECVEHVAIAEEHLLGQVTSAVESAPMINTGREAAIRRRGLDRTKPVPAPEVALPSGRFSSVKEALANFDSSRKKTLQFVEKLDADPRARSAEHPVIGKASSYEILLLMALHPRRHAAQIREAFAVVREA